MEHRVRISARIALAAMTVLVAACQPISSALGEDQPPTTKLSPTARKVGAPPPSAVSAPPSAPIVVPPGPNGQSEGYRYRINYPALQPEWRALDDAVHGYAAGQKQTFFAAVKERPPLKAGDSTVPYELQLDFNVAAQTEAFVSVLGTGSLYTGGAHPAPLVASFNEHLASGRVIALGDLFADPAAGLKLVADETRRQLKAQIDARLRQEIADPKALAEQIKMRSEWIDRGTEPTAANFAVFLVDGVGGKAIGLTIIFPPYQVAPYVDGELQIEVPVRVFGAQLKPEYRDAFATETPSNP